MRLRHIKVPRVSTFGARAKTTQVLKANGRIEIVNIGRQPAALLEIVRARDPTFILPARAGGIPARKSAACRTGDSKVGIGPSAEHIDVGLASLTGRRRLVGVMPALCASARSLRQRVFRLGWCLALQLPFCF
jgi:hypothetical protein